jgi:hypothetical protein
MSADLDPAVLANFAKMAMRRLRALPDGKGAEIREILGNHRWEAIRTVAAESWLELGEMIAFCDAIAAVLGEQGSREFWTALMLDTYDTGLLRPMADDVRASHRGPDASQQLIRLAPTAWGLVTRRCGAIEMVDDGDGRLRLHSGTLLPQVVRSRGIQALFVGACQSMLDQFRARARIEVTVDPADPDRIAYTIIPL